METRMGQRREWRDREDSETPTALRGDRNIARESDRGLAGVHGDGEGAARVMHQPTKDALREQLALAATRLIHERCAHELAIRVMTLRLRKPRRPWWRFWGRA